MDRAGSEGWCQVMATSPGGGSQEVIQITSRPEIQARKKMCRVSVSTTDPTTAQNSQEKPCDLLIVLR